MGTGPLAVGNDLVDLKDSDARGKSRDQRFVERVLCPRERQRFEKERSDALLWRLWTAKEAAYKVIAKVHGASPAPRALRVIEDEGSRRGCIPGHVEWEGILMPVRWTSNDDHVHCVAWWPEEPCPNGPPPFLSEVDRMDAARWNDVTLTPREAAAARSEGSAAVRGLAKNLLARNGGVLNGSSRQALEIIRATGPRGMEPPRILSDGRPLHHLDVSLSHHGRFVAAAVTSSESDGLPGDAFHGL